MYKKLSVQRADFSPIVIMHLKAWTIRDNSLVAKGLGN